MASAAPPTEYFQGIDFNLSFYTEGDSSVTLNYVNNNFLKCVGYAYSRAISTSFNGILYCLNGINTTDITASGTITANLFSGSGANLTSLNASNITTGTIDKDRLPGIFNNIGIEGTNPTLKLLDTNAQGNAIIALKETDDNNGFNIEYVGNTDNKLYIKAYNNSATPTTRLTIDRSNGNVGINEASPNHKLHIHEGTTTAITCFPLKISAGAYVNAGNGTATLIGLGTQGGSTTKCAIGHCRTNSYDTGAIVFLCNAALNATNVSMTDERMRIGSNGNISIGSTSTATYKLLVQGSSFINNTLVFNNDYRASGGANYACNKISMYGGGTTPSTTSSYGFGVASNTLEYFSSSAHKFYTGTTGGTGIGTQRFVILSGGNVGIGVNDPTTYKLDVAGTINATNYAVGASDMFDATKKKLLSTSLDYTTLDVGDFTLGTINNARLPTDISVNSFTGDGASITNINATNIATGTINQDRISLTTNKIYENFNTTNFAIINDKIDLPPNYSFNITGYDSHTLHSDSTERKYKGKISANYDDRDGVYKLITTDITNINTTVLRYKAGDKITIRNTANPATDYLLYDNYKYFNSLYLAKRPNNRPLEWLIADGYSVFMYEWRSGDGDGFTSPAAKILQTYEKTYPFTTPISFIVESGFNYYLYKSYNIVDYTSGGTLFINGTLYGDDYNGFNSVFGGGQTFKLQSGGGFSLYDYMPTSYIPADIGIASAQKLGGVKKGRGVAIDATTGEISSVPVSSDLINSMNTSHFKNNTVTGKIDIDTNLAELKGPKGDDGTDGKGWTGATYSATTGKVSFTSTDGTPFVFDTGDLRGGKGDKGDKGDAGDNGTNGKGWTGATYSATTGKVSFASNDGTPFVFDTGDLRGGVGATGKGWTDASYNATSGILTFNSGDGLGFVTGNLKGTNGTNGTNGKGWTSGSYNATTGIVSFASNDAGYAFTTGDLRGGTGANGKGWTSGSYNATTGIVSFASNDAGYAFTTGDLRGASGATITSTQLAALMNTTDHFTLNGTKIDFKTTYKIPTAVTADAVAYSGITGIPTSWTDAQIPTLAITKISGLDTALGATQPKIISTAGQLIIGNGDGLTTTSTGLTWTGGSTNLLTATNLAVSTQATITQLLTTGQTADMFILRNNATNSLTFQQTFQALNDQKWILKQKSNNVDYNLFNFRNGKICVGTSANPAYMLDVVGDVNVTGGFLVNGIPYKPAEAVLANTATVATALATSRNIAGVAFNGTADVVVDYFATNNKPIILQPTTTNFQVVSGYTLSIPGNVRVGGTAIATNILQVGAGGRLRISNGTTDYTMIGTIDTESDTNTKIVISGNTRTGNLGNIQYYSTASGGNHIFYTSITPTTRMTISSSGVNIPNDLGVSGNVGIGVAPSATYKVNVSGSLNATSVFVGGAAITGSKWTTGTPSTNIYYNAGNVGIGTTDPLTYKLNVNGGNTRLSGELKVEGNKLIINGVSPTIYFRDSNEKQGMIHVNGNTMYFLPGPAVNTSDGLDDWAIVANGRWALTLNLTNNNAAFGGDVNVIGLTSTSYITAGSYITASQYILSNDAVYARSSFDTKIRSDAGGMYLEMGDIGNNNYLRFGAFNGRTEFISRSSRPIKFSIDGTGYTWEFNSNGTSWNAQNSTAWQQASDHRIKEDIKKANLQTCYDNVKNINLYRFKYIDGFKEGTKHDRTQLGYIAQQVKQHFPKSVERSKTRIDDKREIPDLASVDVSQINFTLFGAVKQLMRVVEKQSKRIKKLEEMLNILDDDEVDNDADEPYERIVCDEVVIDTIEPSEPEGV